MSAELRKKRLEYVLLFHCALYVCSYHHDHRRTSTLVRSPCQPKISPCYQPEFKRIIYEVLTYNSHFTDIKHTQQKSGKTV